MTHHNKGKDKKDTSLVISKVQAGFPSPAENYEELPLDFNEYLIDNKAATFVVKVAGDSMIEAGIEEGDLLVVDRSISYQEGKTIIAAVDGELTVKKLKKEKGS